MFIIAPKKKPVSGIVACTWVFSPPNGQGLPKFSPPFISGLEFGEYRQKPYIPGKGEPGLGQGQRCYLVVKIQGQPDNPLRQLFIHGRWGTPHERPVFLKECLVIIQDQGQVQSQMGSFVFVFSFGKRCLQHRQCFFGGAGSPIQVCQENTLLSAQFFFGIQQLDGILKTLIVEIQGQQSS